MCIRDRYIHCRARARSQAGRLPRTLGWLPDCARPSGGKVPLRRGAAPRAEPKLLAFAFLQLRACHDNHRYIRRSEFSERRGKVFNIGLSDVHNEPHFHARLNNRYYKLHCPDHPREIQPLSLIHIFSLTVLLHYRSSGSI